MWLREHCLFDYLEYVWEEMGLEQWAEIVTNTLALPNTAEAEPALGHPSRRDHLQ